jgi:hypothetical protein
MRQRELSTDQIQSDRGKWSDLNDFLREGKHPIQSDRGKHVSDVRDYISAR